MSHGCALRALRVPAAAAHRPCRAASTDRLLDLLSTMPRANRPQLAAAQRQRVNIAERGEKYSASSVYAQVLGSGAKGASTALYLFSDQKRYLFNCGEGTQRLAHEHKVKLSRLEHIFITTKSWRNLGGLPGVSLTLQDVGVPNITLHGPPGLDELYNATKRFVVMKDMKVSTAKCSPLEDFEDNVMTVKYVLIGPDEMILEDPAAKRQKLSQEETRPKSSEFEHDDIDYYCNSERPSTMSAHRPKSPSKSLPHKPSRGSPEKQSDVHKKKTEKLLSDLKKKACSVAYICTLKKRLGSLDLNKCVEKGVKPGPLLGLLKQGKDVVLDDGTLVLSKDVKTPDELGPVFIVLEVPDLAHLRESDFREHFADSATTPEHIPSLIVHFTSKHVLSDERYHRFMRKFGPSCQHLIVNSQNKCQGSVAVHRVQYKLHLLDADMFPLLKDSSMPVQWSPQPTQECPEHTKQFEQLKDKIALAQFQNIIAADPSIKSDVSSEKDNTSLDEGGDMQEKLELISARTLTTFHLRPRRELDRSHEPKLHVQEYIQETMNVDGFASSLEQFHHLIESKRFARSASAVPRDYPRVVFLGTGSCIPNKTRNTSAIVVHLDENSTILLDCGEGTYGQMVRFYGHKQINRVMASLRAIYVSHLHADHHIGLIGVLQGRRRALDELKAQHGFKDSATLSDTPLYLLAPGQIMTWLSLYDQQFEKIRQEFELIANQTLLSKSTTDISEVMTAAVLSSIGVTAIKTCLVAHCPNAFGVTLEVQGKDKITYSGDTIPCEELIALGEDSTLLIHEATMEDELADEARIKMHSTTSQAIDIGRRMNAKYTVLTHFSQRYARLPRLSEQILSNNSRVGIAFDNMEITMDDLEILPHMYAPLQLMFAEHCLEMEVKAAKRTRQRIRRSVSPPDLPIGSRPLPQLNSTKNLTQDIAEVSSQMSKMPNELNSAKDSKRLNRKLCTGMKTKRSEPSIIKKIPKASVTDVDAKYLLVKPPSTPQKDLKVEVGYGKPLITPLGKKLVIQRPRQSQSPSNSSHTSTSAKTPPKPMSKPASPTSRYTLSANSSPTKLVQAPGKSSRASNIRVRPSTSPTRRLEPGVNEVRRLQEKYSPPTNRNMLAANVNTKILNNGGINVQTSSKINKSARDKSPEDGGERSKTSATKKFANVQSSYAKLKNDELKKVKIKYQSKEFLMESKYDRIEGLNWISWN